MADILNTSFFECRVPRVWKLADVLPLPKVPMICDFNKDLRLIPLTSTLSKVAEGIVIEKELKPVIFSSIDPGQFGFIPGSTTTFALISMLHHWLGATDGNGSTVRTALLDHRKAFDLVDHHLLIAKLFSPGVIDFLRDYLDTITFKAARGVYLLSQLKRAGIRYDDLLAFYCSVIRSVLEFERIQRGAIRIIFRGLSYSAAIKRLVFCHS